MNKDTYRYIIDTLMNDKESFFKKTFNILKNSINLLKYSIFLKNVEYYLIIEKVVNIQYELLSLYSRFKIYFEGFEEVFLRKIHSINKQSKEVKTIFPYEIHLTLNPKDDLELFKIVCQSMDIKVISLDLNTSKQNMTSFILYGDYKYIEQKVNSIKNTLIKKGFDIIRTKIETVTWNHLSLNYIPFEHSLNYYEMHAQIYLSETEMLILDSIINKLPYIIHKSKNLKKVSLNKECVILTYRNNIVLSKFNQHCKNILDALINFEVVRYEQEYIVLDTNLELDKDW